MRRAALPALVALGCALPAAAQTNDHVFRSWRWPQESASARSAGWGGLAVAVPEDATVSDVNPATLGSLSKGEAFAGLVAFGDGSAPVGDDIGSRRALGLSGVALRVSARLTLGLALCRPRAARVSLAAVRLADGSTDTGELDVAALDLAVGAAWRVRSGLHVGARLARSRVRLRADARHDLPSGIGDLHVRADGEATRVSGGVGLLLTLSPKLGLGLASHTGAAHPMRRTAESPLLGVVLDPGSAFELRRPGTLSLGAHLRLSPRLALGAQLDHVRWSELADGLVISNGARSRDEYRLRSALEPRLGAELSTALLRTSIQVRAGLHAQSPGTLRFTGDERVETSAFPGSDWNLAGSFGASLVTSAGLRLDLALRLGGERPAFLATTGWRF